MLVLQWAVGSVNVGSLTMGKCAYEDVDVDNQYIAIPTIWTMTTPVPWDATSE